MSHTPPLMAQRVATRVFYGLTTPATIAFALFWLVGFNRPFDDNPNFRAPLLTDLLIGVMALMLAATLAATAWAATRPAARPGGRSRTSLAQKAPLITLLFPILLLTLTFALGSTSPLTVNGQPYANTFWLRVADMFVASSLVLLAVAAGAVIYAACRGRRKEQPAP